MSGAATEECAPHRRPNGRPGPFAERQESNGNHGRLSLRTGRRVPTVIRCELRPIGQKLQQLAEPRLVVPPSLDRGAVDGLARLPLAGRPHRVGVALGLEAGARPSRDRRTRSSRRAVCLGRGGRVLVVDVEQPVGREHRAPVIHQTEVLAVVRDEVAAVAREAPVLGEVRRVDRQARVDRVAPAVDDARVAGRAGARGRSRGS